MSGSLITETGSPLQPPGNETPLRADGQHTQAWAAYFQNVAVTLAGAQMRKGVVDGSEARAGDIGEYLTASAATPMASATITNVVSLPLTPGDWDVSGDVAFVTGGGTLASIGCGVGAIDTLINATFPAGATAQHLTTAVHRRNVTAATTVWVEAVAYFSGTVTATGTIRARRTR